jgi:1-acyl-sn-glycerol-3-phosphate acyltransferase
MGRMDRGKQLVDAAKAAGPKAREIGRAAASLDIPWARCGPARAVRETIQSLILGPAIDFYVRRRARGSEHFARLKPPVIMVANHGSHLDTPIILRALPRAWRQRTAVAAAADYFYRKRWVAALVSLLFSTVPIQRKGGGMEKGSADHLHRLLRQRWNLLIYAEGTRSRDGQRGKLHSGAAVLAATNDVPMMPIYVAGTNAAMPPGRTWPKRFRAGRFARHPIEVRFGPPIRALPGEHRNETMARVQAWFDAQEGNVAPDAPRTAPAAAADERPMAAAGSR